MGDYPHGMTLRRLQQWPRAFTRNRRRSPFRTAWSDTLTLLDRELNKLGGGRNAPSVLQIALRDQDFRIDGLPRASAIPEHPGVILHIEAVSQGPLSFPCDAFDRWQDNLRAIALALEALRKVDRYGITPGNEQYTGWRELPTAGETAPWDVVRAERVIRGWAGELADSELSRACRAARRNTHPDRNGGDNTHWNDVERAANILETAGAL